MGKLITYTLFMSVTLALFHYAGLISGTPISWLLYTILNFSAVQDSILYSTIVGALTLGGSALLLGLYFSGKTEMIIKAGIATFVLVLVFDLVAIFQLIASVSILLATVIIAPLGISYLLVVVSWWAGHD